MPRNRVAVSVQRLARDEYNRQCQQRGLQWLRASNVGIGSDYVLRALNSKPKDCANLLLGRFVAQRLQEPSLLEKCEEGLSRLEARKGAAAQALLHKEVDEETANEILSLIAQQQQGDAVQSSSATERLNVKDKESLAVIQQMVSDAAGRCTKRVSLELLEDSVFGRGLHATEKIPRGTAILTDDASFVLPMDSKHCAHCLATLNDGTRLTCPVCDGEAYCSSTCQEAALQTQHAASCSSTNPILQEWSAAMREEVSNATDSRDAKAAMLCLAAARLFAMSTQSEVHPLSHPAVKHLRGTVEYDSSVALHHLGSVAVTLAEAFRQPNLHLEELLSALAVISSNMFLLPEEGITMFPVLSLLNHSCTPNCIVLGPTATRKQLVSVQDIRPGEQLLIDYNPQMTGSLPYLERKELLAQRHFECFCSKCILRK